MGYNSKTSIMIKETNYRLFYNEFSKLMEKHFKKMDRCSYLNSRGEVTNVTLEQQTTLFIDSFWTNMWQTEPERYEKLMKYLREEQDYMFYQFNYRDRLNRAAERFIIANIKTPIYI